MFNKFHTMLPSDAELATQTLVEENKYRFPSFDSNDALTLGLSIRKRFRATNRHAKGKGLVLSIQTIAGHTLFSCTVGDLGHPAGVGDVSLDSWECLEGMIAVVKRTGHSSFYVEKGMSAMGKTAKQFVEGGDVRVNGGAFPIWLENSPICPIAVAAVYSGSSQEDHALVATTIRDYLAKIRRGSQQTYAPTAPPTEHPLAPPPQEQSTWLEHTHEMDQTRGLDSPYDLQHQNGSQV
ncbi:hypothetical protein BKA70DRAFT_1258225 [Coprinopsis sp. MPI-PUGE-AT-0042]|nr:hypothetical protein BKA70DRAFT_1258225 [Coprinopsis sp. MPI-PUGE-AT-0042]